MYSQDSVSSSSLPLAASPTAVPSAAIQSTSLPQLWMGELDQRWDEITIRQIWTSLLGPLGITIHSVKLIRDRQSSQMGLANAGYCFVRFYNYGDAMKVLSQFNGQPVPGTNNERFFRLNWSSANIQAATAASRPAVESSGSPEYSIFVGDLPQGATEHILFDTFKSRYPSCSGAKVMVDQNTGHIRGFGFVKFLDEAEMHRALNEMRGFVLLGRPIRVSPATKSSGSFGGGFTSQSATQAFSPVSIDNTSPSASAPSQSYSDPSNTTIFVGGLNVPISEDQLRELFSKFGDMSYVKIPAGKNCGFVQFYHRASAEAALSEMQSYDIGGGCKLRLSWGARAAQRIWFARQLKSQQSQQALAQAQVQVQAQARAQAQLQSQLQPQLQPVQAMSSQYLPQSTSPQQVYYTQQALAASTLGLSGGLGAPIGNRAGSSTSLASLPSQTIPFSNRSSDSSTSSEETRLNTLLLAARDGNLDHLDINSTVYRGLLH